LGEVLNTNVIKNRSTPQPPKWGALKRCRFLSPPYGGFRGLNADGGFRGLNADGGFRGLMYKKRGYSNIPLLYAFYLKSWILF